MFPCGNVPTARNNRSAPHRRPARYSRSSDWHAPSSTTTGGVPYSVGGPSRRNAQPGPATLAEVDVQSAHVNPAATVPSAFDPVRISCCDRRRGTRPLPVDSLTALIHEHVGVTGARMELGHVVGDVHAVGVDTTDPCRSGRARGSADFRSPGRARRSGTRAMCDHPVQRRRPDRWHVASAPASPPRLPVTLVALVTKKPNDDPDGPVGVSSSQALAPSRITIESK